MKKFVKTTTINSIMNYLIHVASFSKNPYDVEKSISLSESFSVIKFTPF